MNYAIVSMMVCILTSIFAVVIRAENINDKGWYPSNLIMLRCGEIKPRGWIFEQINGDLISGYITHYDKISPMASQNIFTSGQCEYVAPIERKVPSWWCGEVEGLWKESVTKLAFLTDNTQYQQAAGDWMTRLIDHQKKNNGYIGIYKPRVRLNHKEKENGELWTMSIVMLNMLAYYEYTNEVQVLDSVKRGVDLVMGTYNKNNKYFLGNYPGNARGVTQGLAFIDVLEWLYRITGEKKYVDFALFLYRDDWFKNVDTSIVKLLDEEHKFVGHGAHLAEQFMVPFFSSALTPDPILHQAADNAMDIMRYHLTPGGSINSDEAIREERGTADSVKEYCTALELMRAFSRICMITGNMEAAEWTEKIAYNAAQAARFHPYLTAVEYCSSDNRVEIDSNARKGRDSYGACQTAAPCCAMSAARFMPYFVESMWMRRTDHPGLVALQYGPCEVKTKIGEKEVTIIEKTDYPFSDEITLTINCKAEIDFRFHLRKPSNANCWIKPIEGAQIIEGRDFITIKKLWQTGDVVNVRFNYYIEKIMQPYSETVKSGKGGVYFKRGPLVFGLPFESGLKETMEYAQTGFKNWDVQTLNRTGWDYTADLAEEFYYVSSNNAVIKSPWVKSPVCLKGRLVDTQGKKIEVQLVPEGCSILRRVTFPIWEPKVD